MAKRVHAGRSRGGAKRDRRVLLALSQVEQDLITAAADRAGVSRAQWMREVALTATGVAVEDETAETAVIGQPAAAELKRIGRLLNQAVRASNTAAKAGHPMPAGLTEAVIDCREAIDGVAEGIEEMLRPEETPVEDEFLFESYAINTAEDDAVYDSIVGRFQRNVAKWRSQQ